jgi:tetratricopeptide (TPR) repeat protein
MQKTVELVSHHGDRHGGGTRADPWKSLLAVALLGTSALAAAAPYCGELKNGYGPFDFRSTPRSKLGVVEDFHFTEAVQELRHGATGHIGGDVDYLLRAVPNHPRGLLVMMKLSQKLRSPQPPGAHFPTECYFERAVRFQPDDGAAWALYAQYLYGEGKDKRALEMLERAATLSPDDAAISYNLGLVYAKAKRYDDALPLAQKAYGAGFPLPGLKKILSDAGKWTEAPQ